LSLTVRDRLFSEPWQFEFFEAVRLLELIYPDRTAPGEGADPEAEAVHLNSLISFVFPASELQSLQEPESEGRPASMTVNLLSVGGANGPLPDPDSDRVIEQTYRKNPGFARFLDLFHHRVLSLLVRARKLHFPSYSAGQPHQGPVADYLAALFGLGIPSLRNRMKIQDRTLFFYAGILSQHPRSSAGLECMLSDYFGTRARLKQFVGRWRTLEPDQCTTIGMKGRNRELGLGALLGTRYWDQQGGIELTFGPMSFAQFRDFLPRGTGYAPLCELSRYYAGPDFSLHFRLILRAAEVPGSRLGSARLGWTSWLNTRPFADVPLAGDDSQVRLSSRRPADPFARLEVSSLLRY